VAGLASEARQDLEEAVTRSEGLALSVVIVSYNSSAVLGECLSSILETGSNTHFEIIVVDNRSTDGTPDYIREHHPGVRLVENQRNLGYSRAVNRGIMESEAEYVLVLNPDVVVLPGSLDALVAFLENHDDAGIAASKLLNADGSLQHSCRRFYTLWTLLLRRTFLGKIFRNSDAIRRYLMLDFDHASSRPVDWVIGACMLVRKRALADVGLMDERFFLYFEDVDWCYRMWRGGWKVYYVADSVMRHRYARSSATAGVSKTVVAHLMSLVHFYEKWGKAVYALKKYRHVVSTVLLLIVDVVGINVAFRLAYFLRSSMRGLLEKPMFGIEVYGAFVPFANIVIVLSFAFFGLYDPSTGREPGTDRFIRLVRATAVATVILMASTFLAYQTVYSRVLIGVFSLLLVAIVAVLRGVLRAARRAVVAGRFDLTRVVIVGTGETAEHLAERIIAHENLGYDLAGLVRSGTDDVVDSRYPVIGSLDDLPLLLEEQRIGEVIFADPRLSGDAVADFLMTARRSAVDVKMVSGLSGILTQRARVEEFLELPVVTFQREALLRAGAGVKRAADVVVAAVLLVLWSPALAVTALVTSAGQHAAPLDRVRRAGLSGRPFGMYVPRRSDSRGGLRRFVVRHGLDGFPRLLNVLKGEMSFVGPEPVSEETAAAYGARARMRFDARPGIASLSGVSTPGDVYADGDTTALDVYYVQNWSLGGDLRILLRWLARCAAGGCDTS